MMLSRWIFGDGDPEFVLRGIADQQAGRYLFECDFPLGEIGGYAIEFGGVRYVEDELAQTDGIFGRRLQAGAGPAVNGYVVMTAAGGKERSGPAEMGHQTHSEDIAVKLFGGRDVANLQVDVAHGT